jgi:hypothetical protein
LGVSPVCSIHAITNSATNEATQDDSSSNPGGGTPNCGGEESSSRGPPEATDGRPLAD